MPMEIGAFSVLDGSAPSPLYWCHISEKGSYSDKTPSSQLVEVAKITSGYRGKPEVLMKVIIQAQKKMRKRR